MSAETVATVRLLIADTDAANQLLDDLQIEDLLTLEGESVKLAAAQALDIIASSEALVSKVIKSQDLSTDGPKTARALREHAASLRGQAAAADEDGDGFYFGVIDMAAPAGPEHTAGY